MRAREDTGYKGRAVKYKGWKLKRILDIKEEQIQGMRASKDTG